MVCFMVFPFVVCVVLIVSGDGGLHSNVAIVLRHLVSYRR